MSKTYFRHKDKGTIYNYNVLMEGNAALELISEKEAFPHKFLSEKQKKRTPKVQAEVIDEPEFDFTMPELAKEASKGMP